VQTDIRGLGQTNSSDVDEWVTRARQLQHDIEKSQAIAREIVKNHEDGNVLARTELEAKAKSELLQSEISFNQALESSLEELKALDIALGEAEKKIHSNSLVELAGNIGELFARTEHLTDGLAKDIVRGRLKRVQDALVEGLLVAAISMVDFDKASGQQQVTVNHGNHGKLFVSR
jgi:protein transport protein DSL1/ZW10